MSDSNKSDDSKSEDKSQSSSSEQTQNEKFLPLQKEGESDQNIAEETEVSKGNVEAGDLDQLIKESKEAKEGQESGGGGEEGGESKESGGGGDSSGGNNNKYPLPSEQKQLEREREGEESNE